MPLYYDKKKKQPVQATPEEAKANDYGTLASQGQQKFQVSPGAAADLGVQAGQVTEKQFGDAEQRLKMQKEGGYFTPNTTQANAEIEALGQQQQPKSPIQAPAIGQEQPMQQQQQVVSQQPQTPEAFRAIAQMQSESISQRTIKKGGEILNSDLSPYFWEGDSQTGALLKNQLRGAVDLAVGLFDQVKTLAVGSFGFGGKDVQKVGDARKTFSDANTILKGIISDYQNGFPVDDEEIRYALEAGYNATATMERYAKGNSMESLIYSIRGGQDLQVEAEMQYKVLGRLLLQLEEASTNKQVAEIQNKYGVGGRKRIA